MQEKEDYIKMLYNSKNYLACYFFINSYFKGIENCEEELREIYKESCYAIANKTKNKNGSLTVQHFFLRECGDYKDAQARLHEMDEEYENVLQSDDLIGLFKNQYRNKFGHYDWLQGLSAWIYRLFVHNRKKESNFLTKLENRVELHKIISRKAKYQNEKREQFVNKVLDYIKIHKDNDFEDLYRQLNKIVHTSFYNQINNGVLIEAINCCYSDLKHNLYALKQKRDSGLSNILWLKRVLNVENISETIINDTKETLNLLFASQNEKIEHVRYTYDYIINNYKQDINELLHQVESCLQNKKNLRLARKILMNMNSFFQADNELSYKLNEMLLQCQNMIKDLPANNDLDRKEDLNYEAEFLLQNPNIELYNDFRNKLSSFAYKKLLNSFKLNEPVSHFYTQKWNGPNYNNCRCEILSFRSPNTLGNDLMFNMLCKFKNIIFFDVETTGLHPICDKIIEFSYVKYDGLELVNNTIKNKKIEECDFFIQLPNGRELSENIVQLTHITKDMLDRGITEQEAKARIIKLIKENKDALFIAYNASFDISFIFELLKEDAYLLYDLNFFDLYYALRNCVKHWGVISNKVIPLTSYKLNDIIYKLGIGYIAYNSHRSIDDAKALYYVLKELEEYGYGENLLCYINQMYYPESRQYTLPQITYANFYKK